jgi:hypothetical protein
VIPDLAWKLRIIGARARGILTALASLPDDLVDTRELWTDQIRIERCLGEIREAAQAIVDDTEGTG